MSKQPEPLSFYPNPPAKSNRDEIDLHDYLAVLLTSKWLIIAIALLALMGGILYILFSTPIYRSDVLLQVEEQRSGIGGLEELSEMFTGEAPAETEIEIIRSRSVLGATVDKLKLDIVTHPVHFPILGALVARMHGVENSLAASMWGMNQYAWGGEKITIDRLEVPAHYIGLELELVAEEQGKFVLFGPNHEPLVSGEVGKASNDKASLAFQGDQRKPSAGSGFNIFVLELVANSGTRFKVVKRPRAVVIRDLQIDLHVNEKGKKTGILQLVLEGANRNLIATILDNISNVYLRQNVDRRSEEAEKTLHFLNKQLPTLKANLNAAETRLNDYRSRLGSIDLNLETQGILEQLTEVEASISELSLKRTELQEKFTENHPVMITLEQKKKQLLAARAGFNGQIKNMPEEVQESVRLTRDVQVANELYLLLLNKTQELNVVKAGTIGNVRILDSALVPNETVKPKKALVLALSLLLGIVSGIAIAFVRQSLSRGMDDPSEIEQQMGLPVYASIQHSDKQAEIVRAMKKGASNGNILAIKDPKDLAIESLRSLRTSMQFAIMDSKNNVIAVTGPSPGIGKSFVSSNLAAVLADAGKKTLLVDADMRKGHLHEYFCMKRNMGLSSVLCGELEIEKAVQPTAAENLYFLPAGIVPPNPSELLMGPRFLAFIEFISKNYDIVVIDTPPVLAVTDAGIVGRSAGMNFVLLRSGQHHIREIQQTIKRLEQNGVKAQGFVFNDVPLRSSVYGYGKYGAYGYNYQYEYK